MLRNLYGYSSRQSVAPQQCIRQSKLEVQLELNVISGRKQSTKRDILPLYTQELLALHRHNFAIRFELTTSQQPVERGIWTPYRMLNAKVAHILLLKMSNAVKMGDVDFETFCAETQESCPGIAATT